MFNFTVAEGTVNGVYVNGIHANQHAFFRSSYHGSFNNALRVMISWMNLDLGFQVCFYGGMTAYQKIWLEYCFLLYLLLLGLLIVFLSHKYIWFTRLVGRNVVPVLSTVVSISFYKLITNLLKVFTCSSNHYWTTEGKKPLIWLEDGTMDCLTGKHIPLLILSLIPLMVVFLYIMCLLMIQCLQKRSNWWFLRWVNKLRPFFDANTGPCRDHYRFWPGLLLLVRLGNIMLTTVDTRTRLVSVALVSVLMFFLIFVFPNGVYKKWPLNIFEFWLLFCLALSFVAVAYDYNRFNEGRANWVMTGAVLILIPVFFYHSFNRVSGTNSWKKMIAWFKYTCKRRSLDEHDDAINENTHLISTQIMPRVVQFNAAREPLLEEN